MEIEKTPNSSPPKPDPLIYSRHHIESFNYLLDKGLEIICRNLKPLEFMLPGQNIMNESVKVSFDAIMPGSPSLHPYECRLTGGSYSIPLFATVKITVDDGPATLKSFPIGEIPLMLQSNRCFLRTATSKDIPLHTLNEDDFEPGGYFIVNGLEKILRTIVVPRKNFPLAIKRHTFHLRRRNFSNCAVSMKCTNFAYKSQTLYLHYTYEGHIVMSIMIRKVEYLIPLIVLMKAIEDIPDKVLIEMLTKDDSFNGVYLLKDLHQRRLLNQIDCLRYLGYLMRDVIGMSQMKQVSDEDVGRKFIDEYVLIHLDNKLDKLKCFSLMTKKLWSLVQDELQPDNLDSLATQEFLSAGQLYGMFLREKIEEMLYLARSLFGKELKKRVESNEFEEINVLEILEKVLPHSFEIGKKIEYLLATGNLKSQTGLDLMQNNGYSIIAERLNNSRFWSHLRSVHRGAYFVEMKTTTVRKLLPENWGFMCPVHTPDGGLCGLLNHLSAGCAIQSPTPNAYSDDQLYLLIETLVQYGMILDEFGTLEDENHLPVILDGRFLGLVAKNKCVDFSNGIRKTLKSPHQSHFQTFHKISITVINPRKDLKKSTQFPCVYLSLSEGRPLREVYNIGGGFIETIDPLEQSYLMIAVSKNELTRSHTHLELSTDKLLSELAMQIPFMVHNQSPRNMYQCQMAKQSMGTSTLAGQNRLDNKMYQVYFPQKPLVSTSTNYEYGFEEFSGGINSVVAVLSYTGYDIEDAMIINKSAYERGFMHGAVHKSFGLIPNNNQDKTLKYSLLNQVDSYKANFDKISRAKKFDYSQYDKTYDINDLISKKALKKGCDIEGMPKVGDKLINGSVKMQYYDHSLGSEKSKYYKDTEPSFIENVFVYSDKDNKTQSNASLKLRFNRNPVVGDKFSSRHGQKGVMGMIWPQSDMPFSESGITPDIIINPNAFPSRMTIGMLIESMAGKANAMEAKQVKAGSFEPCDLKEIGSLLQKHKFNSLGTETLYSGVFGMPLKVEIYQGVVYYQRLRHMIKDKAQARAQGPIDVLTRQPIKGRKKGGGIRFGEMERDALIAHGVSFILKERLMLSSDCSNGFICGNCGNLLGCFEFEDSLYQQKTKRCMNCEKGDKDPQVKKVKVPFVLRYLVNELSAMNIKLSFSV